MMVILEWVCKPNPVPDPRSRKHCSRSISGFGDGHSSRRRITPLARATYPEVVARDVHRALWTGNPYNASLFGLAPRRVCLATECHHPCWWALTPPFHPSPVLHRWCGGVIGWSILCCTCRRVTPPGR